MAVTRQQIEEQPAGVATPHPKWAWQRVESWINHRWIARGVVWVVEGPGEWVPPLQPATITTTLRWIDGAWEGVTPSPPPFGGFCLDECTYRIEATVGDDSTPPEAVSEALRRLVDFAAESEASAPYSRTRIDVGEVTEEREMLPLNFARGLTQSGAADLLRPWRRPR